MVSSYNIIIDHTNTEQGDHSSRSSSFSDDAGSSGGTGIQISPQHSPCSHTPTSENHDMVEDHSWVVCQDEIRPSDSASRPRTSTHDRPLVEAPHLGEPSSRPRYRRRERPRTQTSHRTLRSSESTERDSVDSHNDWHSFVPRSHTYHERQFQTTHPAYSQQGVVPMNQHSMVPYGYTSYQSLPSSSGANVYGHAQTSLPQAFFPQALGPYGTASYYQQIPQGLPFHQSMSGAPSFLPFTAAYAQHGGVVPSPGSPSAQKDDEKFARLEKLLIQQKEEQSAKEAAAEKAAKEKAAKEEAEAKKAKEIKTASDAAAAAAKEAAEKEHKAAEEKKAAEAKAAAPAKQKEKPIKFRDAVGRKFSFPFHLCSTWSGMEFLIKEAFMHIEDLGPHVAEGHYDLLGPHGEIILPHVWATTIEPDWTITMHMWPMTEEKEGEADDSVDIIAIDEGVPPPPPPVPSIVGSPADHGKKKKKKGQSSPGFMFFSAGKKPSKKGKSHKKK